jgi:hypothetical protein
MINVFYGRIQFQCCWHLPDSLKRLKFNTFARDDLNHVGTVGVATMFREELLLNAI